MTDQPVFDMVRFLGGQRKSFQVRWLCLLTELHPTRHNKKSDKTHG